MATRTPDRLLAVAVYLAVTIRTIMQPQLVVRTMMTIRHLRDDGTSRMISPTKAATTAFTKPVSTRIGANVWLDRIHLRQ